MSFAPLRIGLLVPSSNTVMEPDFHRHFKQAVVSTTRILLEQVTRDAELHMLEEELPRAVRLITTTAPDTVIFGCTSAGALGGLAHDDGIRQMIEQQTGVETVTVLQAVLAQLRMIRPQKIAVFTPYLEDLTNAAARSIAEGDYAVVKAVGMGIRENLEIGRVTPAEIVNFAESHMAGAAADCLFLSCTNWQALEAIEPLRRKLGIPIISSNQATMDAVRKIERQARGQTSIPGQLRIEART
jgi:maleate isomerase